MTSEHLWDTTGDGGTGVYSEEVTATTVRMVWAAVAQLVRPP